MDKYYQRAEKYIKSNKVEKALSVFLKGLECGYKKCAYGLLKTVINMKSRTFTDDEAIDIFKSSYLSIRSMAENGDDEAMVIVAESILNGIVDDEEPYLMWLYKASALGNERAAEILNELDLRDSESEEKFDGFIDRTLTVEPDIFVLEELGIDGYIDL